MALVERPGIVGREVEREEFGLVLLVEDTPAGLVKATPAPGFERTSGGGFGCAHARGRSCLQPPRQCLGPGRLPSGRIVLRSAPRALRRGPEPHRLPADDELPEHLGRLLVDDGDGRNLRRPEDERAVALGEVDELRTGRQEHGRRVIAGALAPRTEPNDAL